MKIFFIINIKSLVIFQKNIDKIHFIYLLENMRCFPDKNI